MAVKLYRMDGEVVDVGACGRELEHWASYGFGNPAL